VAFYKSGKFLITGVRNERELQQVCAEVASLLQTAGLQVHVREIRVHNVVAMERIELGRPLEALYRELMDLGAVYEPEQFPGLIVPGKECTYLLFGSGKLICTGSRSIESASKNVDLFRIMVQ